MILKIYDSNYLIKVLIYCYVIINILLFLISTYGFFSGAGNLTTISGIFYLIISTLLSLHKRFYEGPFSLLFSFNTLIFFNIPLAFILIEGENYKFGDGLAAVPYSYNEYAQNLWLGLLYLSILWISIWAALVSIPYKKIKLSQFSLSKISNARIIALGFIVLIVTFFDNIRIINVNIEKVEKLFNIFSFILFDHAYLLITGIIIYIKINNSGLFNTNRNRDTLKIGSLIFISFMILSFLSGSKGAILVIFIIFVLIQLAFSMSYIDANVFGPSKLTVFMLIIFAPAIFYLALLQRINVATANLPLFEIYYSGISKIDLDLVPDVLSQILYRLSWGGLDRFILIFQSFIFEDFNFEFTIHFIIYLFKNMLNLILPGTLFSEAYYPSSQFYPEVLSKNFIESDGDYLALMSSFNTQAYTIYGIFIILFGLIAPFFLYLFTLILVLIFNKVNSILIRASILYFWIMSLSSYGIEVAIGNSAHVFLSMLLMFIITYKFFKFNIALSRIN